MLSYKRKCAKTVLLETFLSCNKCHKLKTFKALLCMQWSHNYHAESIFPFLNTVFWWRNKKVGNFDEISTTFVVGRGELNQNYLLFWSHHIINYVFLVLLHFIHDEWALACNNNVFVQFCFLWREILQHYLSKLLSLKYLRSFKCVQKNQALNLRIFISNFENTKDNFWIL